MTTSEQNIQMKAIAWTVGVHLALLLFFLLFRYAIPGIVQVPELGMEVNLGTADNGSGIDQPMAVEDPSMNVASVANKTMQQQNNRQKDILQSNDKDAPGVNTAANNNSNINNTEQINKKRHQNDQQDNNNQHQQQARYVYNGSHGVGGNNASQNTPGTHEGNDPTGNNDKGVPNGTPGASNYSGSPGNGNVGVNSTLTDRVMTSTPKSYPRFKEKGKVEVRVTVNRDGVIINSIILSATNDDLRAIVQNKIKEVKFNKSTAVPEEQFGKITFVFTQR